MEELIIGIICSAITEGAKKIGRSPKLVILGLSVVCAIIYYVIEAINPDLITFSRHHIVAVYGVSQVIYNYGIKFFGGKTEETVLYPTSGYSVLNEPVPEIINTSPLTPIPEEPVDTGETFSAENVAKNEELTKRILIKKRLRPSVGLGTPTTNLPPSTNNEGT